MQNGSPHTKPIPSCNSPLFGLWQPQLQLKSLYYGTSCVENHLLNSLPSLESRVFIITGNTLATKTPLIAELEALLESHHAGTFAGIRQHGPSDDVDKALELVAEDPTIDTLISLGGGSPIDAAKTIAYRIHSTTGHWLTHITIPTTLSAAECTAGGGYTQANGVKIGFMAPEMGVKTIFYDPHYSSFTPLELWLATGIRALDHAVESFYHPYASEIWKSVAMWAAHSMFIHLPKAKALHPNDSDLTTKLHLAAFMSSGLKGANLKGGMGLSHSLGHALGSPYGISHGMTSCMTLGHVVKMKAMTSEEDAKQIARLLPAVGMGPSSGNDIADALKVGDGILKLVDTLGLAPGPLSSRGVGKEDVPVIVTRSLGGLTEGPVYDAVYELVQSIM